MRTKIFIFQFQNIFKKLNHSPSSFFKFFLMRAKAFIFRGLKPYEIVPLSHILQKVLKLTPKIVTFYNFLSEYLQVCTYF